MLLISGLKIPKDIKDYQLAMLRKVSWVIYFQGLQLVPGQVSYQTSLHFGFLAGRPLAWRIHTGAGAGTWRWCWDIKPLQDHGFIYGRTMWVTVYIFFVIVIHCHVPKSSHFLLSRSKMCAICWLWRWHCQMHPTFFCLVLYPFCLKHHKAFVKSRSNMIKYDLVKKSIWNHCWMHATKRTMKHQNSFRTLKYLIDSLNVSQTQPLALFFLDQKQTITSCGARARGLHAWSPSCSTCSGPPPQKPRSIQLQLPLHS